MPLWLVQAHAKTDGGVWRQAAVMLRPVTSITAALTAQEERERHQRALAVEVKALRRELAEARAQIQALQGDANKIVSWSIDRKNYRATPFLPGGKPSATLDLRGLFEQYHFEVGD
jgi:hypothetical protein